MIRVCSACSQHNRVGAQHLAARGKCGSCKAPLPPLSEPLDVDEAEFDDIVKNAKVPILVDFWAAWCGPCRMAAPEVKRVAQEMSGKAIVLKVDTERSGALARRFGISGIPNFMVFKDGRVALQQAGLVGHRQLQQWLQQAA